MNLFNESDHAYIPNIHFIIVFFRLWLAKYFSMMVVVMLSVYYAVPTRRRYDPNSTAVAFVHLMSFAMHFGAQCWVTFIAGN